MPDTLTSEQEARLEAEVVPLERAAYQHRQNDEKEQDIALQREALVLREAIVGPVNETLADGLVSLAIDLRDEGQYEEAEALFLRGLSIYKALHGPTHKEIATALFGLGCLYDEWERYNMSLPVYLRALAMEERIYGKRSHEVAATCTWLGDAHVELSQYARAEPYFRRAAEIHQARQTWQGTARLALIKERLAGTLFRLKRQCQALAAYEDVLALNKGRFCWAQQSRRRFNLCRVRCMSATDAVDAEKTC